MSTPRIMNLATLIVMIFALSAAPGAAQTSTLEGCLSPGGGEDVGVDYYLPNLTNGFLVISDERRTDQQLAATFTDPADVLSRLHAYCWIMQAERVYARELLLVDVSLHKFAGSEGAILAQYWFGYQRMNDLNLTRDVRTSQALDEALRPARLHREVLNNIRIYAFLSDAEYTLYAQRQNIVARVTVSGVSSLPGASRERVAYQVLAMIFGIDLFDYPYSSP